MPDLWEALHATTLAFCSSLLLRSPLSFSLVVFFSKHQADVKIQEELPVFRSFKCHNRNFFTIAVKSNACLKRFHPGLIIRILEEQSEIGMKSRMKHNFSPTH